MFFRTYSTYLLPVLSTLYAYVTGMKERERHLCHSLTKTDPILPKVSHLFLLLWVTLINDMHFKDDETVINKILVSHLKIL